MYDLKRIIFNKQRILKLLIPVTCFLIPATCYGALLFPLNDLKVIEIAISRQGLTRITVKEDRILNVFGVTGEYVLETDEEQGQVFIRPMGPGSLNPVSLTVTTEKGHTQDLRLIPKDKAPEALILQANETLEKEMRAVALPSREEVEELIHACQADRIPVGYTLNPLDLKTLKTPYLLVRAIHNGTLQGLTYEVKNTGSIPWILSESGFAEKLNENVIAILMPQKLLKPGEITYVYVVAKATR